MDNSDRLFEDFQSFSKIQNENENFNSEIHNKNQFDKTAVDDLIIQLQQEKFKVKKMEEVIQKLNDQNKNLEDKLLSASSTSTISFF